jgi:hypothetical protein
MKKNQILFLLIMLISISFSVKAQDNKGLARVNKIQGKEVYVICEPERPYEVVDKVNSVVSQLIGVSPTVGNMINTLVDKAVNKEKKGKVQPFDAIVTSDGTNAILIKFKEGSEDKKGIGRVTKMQGKEIYVMCEPLLEYETVNKVNSAFAQIIGVDPTVENMIKTLVDKAVDKERKGSIEKFDAVITSDGDNAILVKFKYN